MFDYTKCGMTQKLIAKISGDHNNSTVSRWVSKLNVQPLFKDVDKVSKNIRYSIPDVRRIFKTFVYPDISEYAQTKVMSFYNFKGGTGKTSICYQVSTHLALMGFNVLVIDADPQAHLSSSLGFENDHELPTMFDILNGTVSVERAAHNIFEGLDCVPSSLSLTRLEVLLNETPKREERVRIAFEKTRDKYDFIIFDTNPNISLVNRNILVFSDLVNIVCETQPYSLNGLRLLMTDFDRFCRGMQINPPKILIIPNKYEDRSSSSAEAMTVLRKYYPGYTIPDFAVRKSEEIVTSAKSKMPLGFFARTNSIAFEDISDLIRSILSTVASNVTTSEIKEIA